MKPFITILKSSEKYLTAVLVYGMALLTSSCFKEEIIPVTTRFTYQVTNNDYSIPVEIAISNLTSGAENYQWTFEGGQPVSSDKRNPGTIAYSKEGQYKIRLEAWNEDNRQSMEMTVQVLGTVVVDFTADIAVNNISPVDVTITNKTVGGTGYRWKFRNGSISSFNGFSPPPVRFTDPGDHVITLYVENGNELDSLSKVITVTPALSAAFKIEPSFADDDYEAPLKARLVNESVGGLTWKWTSSGGQVSNENAKNPSVFFEHPGTYQVTLTSGNGKETQTTTRSIVVNPNSRLRTLADVKLGINTAHATIGSFYSTALRRVITKNDPDSLQQYVDIVFFGLNPSFTFNRFVSPDSAHYFTFSALTMPQTVYTINSQEKCLCSTAFSETDFDQLTTGGPLDALSIEPGAGTKPFDGTTLPRIVLFRTKDNRKGAIKVKAFHSEGQQSYIIADIKIQKE